MNDSKPMLANGRFFLLSGEESTLPVAELVAIVETYDNKARFKTIDKRVVIAYGEFHPNSILRRSAYVNAGGYLLTICRVEDLERSIDTIAFEEFMDDSTSFAASVFNLSSRTLSERFEAIIGSAVKRRLPNAKVSLEDPKQMIIGIIVNDNFIIGFTDYTKRRGWRLRRPRARPFFHPSALYPKFARGLVNLSRIKEGEVLLDPFCGTGSILMEATLIGANVIGIDVSMKMCRGALNNLRYYALGSLGIVNSDAMLLSVRRVDAIATDIPYGRCASSRGMKTQNLLQKFIFQAEGTMPRGRCCVIVHPSTIELDEVDGFEVKEKHEVYVHRTLTRIIAVLKRK
ncbi:MAG: DNA methyltransferase [Nitrososphaerales archaeon]